LLFDRLHQPVNQVCFLGIVTELRRRLQNAGEI
jgi:hypothetical protein